MLYSSTWEYAAQISSLMVYNVFISSWVTQVTSKFYCSIFNNVMAAISTSVFVKTRPKM
jgi:flagellar biosynthesis protein FliQ